jgi:2-keto-3-deoxy-L-rhamnonate aldolase RhmA
MVRARQPISPWENPVARALREGKVCLGALSISFPCPAVAQISAQAGFHWLYFDMEHSGLSVDAIQPICDASKLAGIVPIVGTSGIADFLISRPLDVGAMGVIAPHVNTRAETELVVNASRYAPLGTRGFITLAPSTEFEDADPTRWVETGNREILVAVKVESARGIENVEEIAAVRGLDAILVGPGDLSATYGIPGQTDHPQVRAAIERMLAACQRNGIAGGPHVGSAEAARAWAERGATFMSVGFDGALLLEASRRLMADARDLLGPRLA